MMKKLWFVLFLIGLCSIISGQDIFIDEMPEFQSDQDMYGHVTGITVPEMYAVHVFLFYGGWWYPKPSASSYCLISDNLTWTCDVTGGGYDTEATRYFAFLTPVDYVPPQSGGEWGQWHEFLPDEFADFPYTFTDRLPGNREISFGDLDWICKTFTAQAGPGNNYFSDALNMVFVDNNDDLHLNIIDDGDFWHCSEIVCEEKLGYGTYIFTLADGFPDFPLEAVLGLFSWDEAITFNPNIDNIYHEIDVELSYWGDSNTPFAQYVVQPWYENDNRYQFDYYPEGEVSCAFNWSEDQLNFVTWSGDAGDYPPDEADIIEAWEYSGNDIPPAGNARARLNLWLLPDADIGENLEVVISDFVFYPPPVTVSKEFTSGWNWFALNVRGDDMSTNAVLASIGNNASNLKSQTQSSIYYEGTGWFGSLTHIDNVSLYKLEVENPSTLEYSGVPVNVRLNTYELTDGWNWISFAPQEAQEINYALADLENGAAIKSQVESAIYYEGVGWYGSMTMLEPLQGYLINMNAPEQFNFPEPVADSGNVAIDHIEIPEPDDEDNGNIAELDKLSCFPNPFNPATTISFSIPVDCNVELAIYNIKGQRIKKLRSSIMEQGDHSVIWDGNDENGKRAGSGIYFYQLAINGKTEAVNKCLLLK